MPNGYRRSQSDSNFDAIVNGFCISESMLYLIIPIETPRCFDKFDYFIHSVYCGSKESCKKEIEILGEDKYKIV